MVPQKRGGGSHRKEATGKVLNHGRRAEKRKGGGRMRSAGTKESFPLGEDFFRRSSPWEEKRKGDPPVGLRGMVTQ